MSNMNSRLNELKRQLIAREREYNEELQPLFTLTQSSVSWTDSLPGSRRQAIASTILQVKKCSDKLVEDLNVFWLNELPLEGIYCTLGHNLGEFFPYFAYCGLLKELRSLLQPNAHQSSDMADLAFSVKYGMERCLLPLHRLQEMWSQLMKIKNLLKTNSCSVELYHCSENIEHLSQILKKCYKTLYNVNGKEYAEELEKTMKVAIKKDLIKSYKDELNLKESTSEEKLQHLVTEDDHKSQEYGNVLLEMKEKIQSAFKSKSNNIFEEKSSKFSEDRSPKNNRRRLPQMRDSEIGSKKDGSVANVSEKISAHDARGGAVKSMISISKFPLQLQKPYEESIFAVPKVPPRGVKVTLSKTNVSSDSLEKSKISPRDANVAMTKTELSEESLQVVEAVNDRLVARENLRNESLQFRSLREPSKVDSVSRVSPTPDTNGLDPSAVGSHIQHPRPMPPSLSKRPATLPRNKRTSQRLPPPVKTSTDALQPESLIGKPINDGEIPETNDPSEIRRDGSDIREKSSTLEPKGTLKRTRHTKKKRLPSRNIQPPLEMASQVKETQSMILSRAGDSYLSLNSTNDPDIMTRESKQTVTVSTSRKTPEVVVNLLPLLPKKINSTTKPKMSGNGKEGLHESESGTGRTERPAETSEADHKGFGKGNCYNELGNNNGQMVDSKTGIAVDKVSMPKYNLPLPPSNPFEDSQYFKEVMEDQEWSMDSSCDEITLQEEEISSDTYLNEGFNYETSSASDNLRKLPPPIPAKKLQKIPNVSSSRTLSPNALQSHRIPKHSLSSSECDKKSTGVENVTITVQENEIATMDLDCKKIAIPQRLIIRRSSEYFNRLRRRRRKIPQRRRAASLSLLQRCTNCDDFPYEFDIRCCRKIGDVTTLNENFKVSSNERDTVGDELLWLVKNKSSTCMKDKVDNSSDVVDRDLDRFGGSVVRNSEMDCMDVELRERHYENHNDYSLDPDGVYEMIVLSQRSSAESVPASDEPGTGEAYELVGERRPTDGSGGEGPILENRLDVHGFGRTNSRFSAPPTLQRKPTMIANSKTKHLMRRSWKLAPLYQTYLAHPLRPQPADRRTFTDTTYTGDREYESVENLPEKVDREYRRNDSEDFPDTFDADSYLPMNKGGVSVMMESLTLDDYESSNASYEHMRNRYVNTAYFEDDEEDNIYESVNDIFSVCNEEDKDLIKKLKEEETLGETNEEHHVLTNQYRSERWSSIPDVVDSGVLENLTARERALYEAKYEVISSKVSYLKSLSILSAVFADSPELSKVLTPEQWDLLFGFVHPMKRCSEHFLADLLSGWPGDLFLSDMLMIVEQYSTSAFDVYIRYCSNQIAMYDTLKHLRETNKEFGRILSRLEADEIVDGHRLESFLILPVQRITRFPLLVDSIVGRLPFADEDYERWKKTHQQLQKVTLECNEAVRRAESEKATLSPKVRSSSKPSPSGKKSSLPGEKKNSWFSFGKGKNTLKRENIASSRRYDATL